MLDNTFSAALAEERRLRAAVEQDLNLRLRQQEAIAWLGEHALTCQNLDEVFQAAVRVAADTLTMEFCKILEHLPAENALLLRSGVGWAEGLVGSTLIGAERNSQAGFTLINVEPVIVDNLAAETRFTDLQLLTDHHVISGMGVVIPGKERPFGVLSVHSAQHRKFVLQDTRFIKAIAGLLASAIQRFSSEEDLRRSRNELAIILQGINEGVTVQDRSGRLVYANQAAAEFMGFASVEEVLRSDHNDLMDRFCLFNELGQPFLLDDLPGRQVLRGAPRASVNVRFQIVASGQERWALVDASPVLDADGQVIQAVNIFRDVTDLLMSEKNALFLAQASEILASSIDYQETLTNVAQLAVTDLADWCSIVLLNQAEEAFQLTVAHKDSAKVAMVLALQKQYPPKFDQASGVGKVLRSGRAEFYPAITNELIAAAAVDAEHLAAIRAIGMRSVIIMPLLVRGRTVGAITMVWADSGRRYTQRDVALTEELAHRAAIAIDNARLFHSAQLSNQHLEQRVEVRTRELSEANLQLACEIEERQKTQQALQKSQVMLNSLFESAPDAVLLVNQAGKIVHANQQAESMFAYTRSELLGLAVHALLPDLQRGRRMRKSGPYFGEMDARAAGEARDLVAKTRDGSAFPVDIMLSSVKMEEGEMTICSIRNISEQKHLQAELDETHRRLFESVEAERLRISQELHDGPIQELYGLALYFEGLRDYLDAPEQVKDFQAMKDNLQNIAQMLRGTCGELRPPTLAHFGVEKAIRSHLSKLRETHPNIDVEAHLMSDGQALSERARLALYRVYQNAISNILRHAQASQIQVKFMIEEGQIEMIIGDNGRGFSVPVKWVDLAREGHFGLVGMAERVEAIGGEFMIESQTGQGTTVRVVVPLAQPLMSASTSLS